MAFVHTFVCQHRLADNITDNQARDYLAASYPGHFQIDASRDAPRVRVRESADDLPKPDFQSAFGLTEDVELDDDVAEEVPEYGIYVNEQITRLGRNHPMIKTQYFSEEIDAEGGLFPPERIKLMQGTHVEQSEPVDGQLYAMTIDVAGEEEDSASETASVKDTSARDATSLTLFNVDLSTLPPDVLGAPTYRVVARFTWTGKKHTKIYNAIKVLAKTWRAEYIVIDSTGVGQGLSSFIERAFPGRVIPYYFTQKSKSDLGWKFLAVIETGRYKEPVKSESLFWQQAQHCQHEVLEGPGRIMRWGVPDGTRDEITRELVHDDELISAALCSILDEQEWSIGGEPVVVQRPDPLLEMDNEGF